MQHCVARIVLVTPMAYTDKAACNGVLHNILLPFKGQTKAWFGMSAQTMSIIGSVNLPRVCWSDDVIIRWW